MLTSRRPAIQPAIDRACLPPSQYRQSLSSIRSTLICLFRFPQHTLNPHFSISRGYTAHPARRPSPQNRARILTSISFFQNPAHTAPLESNLTLSVAQRFIQALLPILLVHLTDRDLAALPNCLHNPLPCTEHS